MKRAAIGVILDSQKKQVLLVKRRDVPVWVLPGGGVEPQETTEQAVCREVLEETGLHVRIVRQIALYTPANRLSEETHLFLCEAISGQLTTGAETQELAYFPCTGLPDQFFFIHKDWLQDALSDTPGLVQKPLTSVNYSNLLLYGLQHPWHILRFAWTRLMLMMSSK